MAYESQNRMMLHRAMRENLVNTFCETYERYHTRGHQVYPSLGISAYYIQFLAEEGIWNTFWEPEPFPGREPALHASVPAIPSYPDYTGRYQSRFDNMLSKALKSGLCRSFCRGYQHHFTLVTRNAEGTSDTIMEITEQRLWAELWSVDVFPETLEEVRSDSPPPSYSRAESPAAPVPRGWSNTIFNAMSMNMEN